MASNGALERLTNLTLLLLEADRPLSLNAICDEITGYPSRDNPTARRRQFERDKALLRQEGVPIKMIPLADESQHGYQILKKEYYLPDINFTDGERQALAIAASEVHIDDFSSVNSLRKLGVELVTKNDKSTASDDKLLMRRITSHPILPDLYNALRRHKPVRIKYHNRERTVAGYGLVSRSGAWYFIGRDNSYDEVRTFRVDRIDGDVAVDEAAEYAIPESFSLESEFPTFDWEFGREEPIEANVYFSNEVAQFVTNFLGEDKVIEENQDGSKVMEVAVVNIEAFRSWVMSFGRHAKVISPPEIVEMIIEYLRSIVKASETRL